MCKNIMDNPKKYVEHQIKTSLMLQNALITFNLIP